MAGFDCEVATRCEIQGDEMRTADQMMTGEDSTEPLDLLDIFVTAAARANVWQIKHEYPYLSRAEQSELIQANTGKFMNIAFQLCNPLQ
jgi:hypothetical protein